VLPKTLKTAAPVAGETVAGYAMDCLSYNETTRDWRVHNGVDIAAEAGTEVLAAADGTVYTTYTDDVMGTTVVIRHTGGYTTQYASLSEELKVSPGDQVVLGQAIGCVGETALIETNSGPHVHFTVLLEDEPVDPGEFLAMGGE
jgi:murein DD-endopeptidase MepM/ murein hydrolase activator NlpD